VVGGGHEGGGGGTPLLHCPDGSEVGVCHGFTRCQAILVVVPAAISGILPMRTTSEVVHAQASAGIASRPIANTAPVCTAAGHATPIDRCLRKGTEGKAPHGPGRRVAIRPTGVVGAPKKFV
jgi:hypothetical protein